MNIELLADSDIPGQGIVFIIVIIFSFLKWLYTSLTNKPSDQQGTPEGLEDLYEQYREGIQQRQTVAPPQPATPEAAPPVLPPELKKEPAPKKFESVTSLAYSQDDIRQARLLKKSVALASPKVKSTVKKSEHRPSTKSLRKQLRSNQSLRNAIVLKEVLGSPKALKDS